MPPIIYSNCEQINLFWYKIYESVFNVFSMNILFLIIFIFSIKFFINRISKFFWIEEFIIKKFILLLIFQLILVFITILIFHYLDSNIYYFGRRFSIYDRLIIFIVLDLLLLYFISKRYFKNNKLRSSLVVSMSMIILEVLEIYLFHQGMLYLTSFHAFRSCAI